MFSFSVMSSEHQPVGLGGASPIVEDKGTFVGVPSTLTLVRPSEHLWTDPFERVADAGTLLDRREMPNREVAR